MIRLTCLVAGLLFVAPTFGEEALLVEAESFDSHGGWQLDTQFIREMGSPYLLAHGLGKPVADAETTVNFPSTGTYQVFVRTKDWVARWKAEGQPGRFQLSVNGKPLATTFGTTGAEWHWQEGGTVEITEAAAATSANAVPNGDGAGVSVKLSLHDLTGFDGRVDAVYFVKRMEGQKVTPPPNAGAILPQWRRQLLGLGDEPTVKEGYDLVVIGGGYSGLGAAISAARAGCKVALIQDRGVLGGNGSSEVRVWAMGNIRRGKYPRIGEIIEEISDHAKKSPGTYEEFEDAKKEAIVRAEKNIDLFLHHHAYQVDVDPPLTPELVKEAETTSPKNNGVRRVTAVYAFDTRTSETKKFVGKLFCDATGHGTIGALAVAEWDMTPKGRMGMSNMWAWDEGEQPVTFPPTPWALDLTMQDFPYPRDHHGQWFWESGYDKDPLGDAEGVRDWNFRAVYGAFNAMKNRDGADKHKTAFLTWVAYIGGPRESRRLLGDVLLTQEDIVSKKDFPDGCVPSTWSIDLHYPKKQYAEKFPDNPFISIAEHGAGVDRNYGYPVPYRCFYSRNIENLFMAGRCISVTHEALGTTRVMKTCGMMGEVVGKAASVCVSHDCLPRDVYDRYWSELDELLKLPGKAYRASVSDSFTIPADALPEAGPQGAPTGLDPKKLEGLVLDDTAAKTSAGWTSGTGLKGYVGHSYLYATQGSNATCTWKVEAPAAGEFDVRVAYLPHENRGSKVRVTVKTGGKEQETFLDMRKQATLPNDFASVGKVRVGKGDIIEVTIHAKDCGGNAHADAVQVVPVN
ncbi:MAG: FAD-dependent oxidoreductase [Planctomycetaceae bacterium]